MKTFLKSIIVGLGGVAPGLSGSVLLIIFGLYQQTLDALGTLLINFRKKVSFLFPVVSGMFVGVLIFSKLVDFCLNNYEMQTRFCFLGLILGTVPLFYSEVKKKGFSKKYYVIIVAALLFGLWMFRVNPNTFEQIKDPNLIQSVILGVAVSATAIIPGVDPAVLLSSMGIYEAYVSALANFDLHILIPMLLGLAMGAMFISFLMSFLFKRIYTLTFSIIFGIFLSMIPNMLNEKCVLSFNKISIISVALMLVGFCISYYLGDVEKHNKIVRTIFRGKEG